MSGSGRVRIYKRGDRGFHGYGREFNDAYGSRINVYESSSAESPHVWVNVNNGQWKRDPGFDASAHLNPAQAKALIARLQTWLDEIPKRWGK